MPRWTYATLGKNMGDLPCILLTTEEEYTGTSNIEWKCKCGKILKSTYKEIVRWKGKCKDCRKIDYKPTGGNKKPLIYTYDKVKEIFEDSGCQLLTDRKHYQGPRKPLDWKCKCGDYQKSPFSSFKESRRCKLCSWKANGGITYQEFCDLLQQHDWEMIGDEKEYRNTKTIMKARSDTGGITETSYNRFQQGHRSKEKADDSFRSDYEKVEKAFSDKGFHLLDKTYVNMNTPMEYRCRCGGVSKMTYSSLKDNVYGCVDCHRSSLSGNMLCRWEYDGDFHLNALLSKNMKKYEFPSGRVAYVQGYENICIDGLLDSGINEKDIIVEFQNVPTIQYKWEGHYHTYYPDIYIESENKLIEVKSDFTISYKIDQNRKKWIAAAREGYLMEIRVYIRKREIERRTYEPYKNKPIIKKFNKKDNKQGKMKPVKITNPFIDRGEFRQVEIEGWPGCIVTDDGRVFGNHNREYVKFLVNRVVKVQLQKKVDGKWKRHRCAIDYLVLKHFLPPDQAKNVDNFRYLIHHKNENPCDNRLENLELRLKEDTYVVNPSSDTVGKGILQFSTDNELLGEYDTVTESSKKTGVSVENIKQACRKEVKAGGFIWRYKEYIRPEPVINIKKWMKIPEFPNYRISRSGDIWSTFSNRHIQPYQEGGKLKVKLRKDSKRYTRSVHLLVAKTYLPPPPLIDMQIRHKNMNVLDNRIGNLEWISKKSVNHPCKAVIQYNLEGIELNKYNSLKEAAENSGADPNAITKVCNEKRKTAGGFRWKWK